MTDHELVAAVRAGDDRAFEQLYTRYHRRIASYIYGMVHDHGRAEDITQDVFMSALRRMRETDRPIAFKPWVYEIAKNACIDQFRRSRRTEEVSYDADAGLAAADHSRLTSRGPTPDVAVEHKQQLDHLRGAFGGLSDAHHEILVMREFEGLSYREIGDRLGMSRPSVESTLFRARRRLTEEYDELVTGERCRRVQAIVTEATEGALGARDRRRLGRHISHCQPCRRQASLAGLDTVKLAESPVRARLAALLPLPAFLRRRSSGDESFGSQLAASAHPFAQWSTTVAHYVEPGIAGWVKAAAAAATLAAAGTGVNATVGDQGLTVRPGITDSVLGHSHPSSSPSSAPSARQPSTGPLVLPAPVAADRGPVAVRPRAADDNSRPASRTSTGSSGGLPSSPQQGVPGAPTPPVDDAPLRKLIEPPPSGPANSTPRPESGGNKGGLNPEQLVPKAGGTPSSGPGEVPVSEPAKIPEAATDELGGAADRADQTVTDITGG